ncbi:recA-superfamily ATPases implicated in signal transduction (plasmid) [Serpentinimonas maccroryi]|uniref:RecA-superfamily ATPases implicated in signal transduction n=1 Tax=Serpentinimonas maccroryi TaxID=1458426 RepID=A0A060NS56_9BURK|nr:recA-superfamily ATPases implicated in signal transduction [Serpentinimonas maccroryi]
MIAHESYRLVYEIDGSTVWILALVHTRPPVATSDGVARGAGCLHCTTSYTRPALAPIGLYAGWAAVARLDCACPAGPYTGGGTLDLS